MSDEQKKAACMYHASEEGGGVHQPTCAECIEAEANPDKPQEQTTEEKTTEDDTTQDDSHQAPEHTARGPTARHNVKKKAKRR